MNQKNNNLISFSDKELEVEIARRKKIAASSDMDDETIPLDKLIANSGATFMFSRLFDKDYPSAMEFVSVRDDMFEARCEFDFPRLDGDLKIPSVLAIETDNDFDFAPWVDVSDYIHFRLFDQNGEALVTASMISFQTLGDFEHDLKSISDGFDLATADWSWFFLHPFFAKAPKDTSAFMFIESLWVDEALRGHGFGKWMVGAMMKHFMDRSTYGDIKSGKVVVGVIPFPKERGISFENDKDKFLEREKELTAWYEHVFECLKTTEDFVDTKNFTFKDDKQGEDYSRVIYWSAGGKKERRK